MPGGAPTAAPDAFTPPVLETSPLHEVAEGRNGDDEHAWAQSALCPVRNAVLYCPELDLLSSSGVAAQTPSNASDRPQPFQVGGRWPDELWAIADRAQPVLLRGSARGWTVTAHLDHASVADSYFASPLGRSGYLVASQVLVSNRQHPDCRDRPDADCGHLTARLTLTAFSRAGARRNVRLTDASGAPVLASFTGVRGFEDETLVVTGRGGPELYGGAELVVRWASPASPPAVVRGADCAGDIVGDSAADFFVFGAREGAACAIRVRGATAATVDVPSGAWVGSAAIQPDGTQWIVLAGHGHGSPPFNSTSRLFRRRPGAAFEAIALPDPQCAMIPAFGQVQPRGVHVDASGDVWVEAEYIEHCVRGIVYTTAEVKAPCALGARGCLADGEREKRIGDCAWMRK